VGAQDVRVAGRVESGVEGIGPPAVLLVDHGDVDGPTAPVDGAYRRGGNLGPVGDGDLLQLEGVDQGLEGAVGGAGVGDDDLDARVHEQRHRPDGVDDADHLVVGGDDDGDRGSGAGREHLGDPSEPVEVVVAAERPSRDQVEPEDVG